MNFKDYELRDALLALVILVVALGLMYLAIGGS